VPYHEPRQFDIAGRAGNNSCEGYVHVLSYSDITWCFDLNIHLHTAHFSIDVCMLFTVIAYSPTQYNGYCGVRVKKHPL